MHGPIFPPKPWSTTQELQTRSGYSLKGMHIGGHWPWSVGVGALLRNKRATTIWHLDLSPNARVDIAMLWRGLAACKRPFGRSHVATVSPLSCAVGAFDATRAEKGNLLLVPAASDEKCCPQ